MDQEAEEGVMTETTSMKDWQGRDWVISSETTVVDVPPPASVKYRGRDLGAGTEVIDAEEAADLADALETKRRYESCGAGHFHRHRGNG
jgi:hypothetical protein